MATKVNGRALSPVSSDSGSSSASASEREEEREVKRRKVTFEENDALGQAAVSAFVPPKGLQKVAPDESLEDFDHDKLKQKLANGCELWAIRIPDGLKLRHLSDVQLAKPTLSERNQSLGNFTAKKSDYEVLSVGNDASSIGAGEMLGLIPLVGSKSTKKYGLASAPIARHIVVRRDFATPPESFDQEPEQEEDAEQMQSARLQPEGLTGFFAPPGFHTQPLLTTSESSQPKKKKKKTKHPDVSTVADASSQDISMAATPAKDASGKEKKEKKKKRKSEAQ